MPRSAAQQALTIDEGNPLALAGIATAQNHDFLSARIDGLALDRQAGHAPILLGEEIHREMHPAELAAGDGKITRLFGADRQADRIV